MQQVGTPQSRPTPPPDVASSFAQQPIDHSRLPAQQNHLIVGLFALRLARSLILSLEEYNGREAAVAWIDRFLAAYPLDYALARIAGAKKDNYLATYPRIIAMMKRQPRYPICFMRLHPRGGISQTSSHGVAQQSQGGWTDIERLNMIDFCDAAAEWGSSVPLPVGEANRMVELAEQRRVAVFGNDGSDLDRHVEIF